MNQRIILSILLLLLWSSNVFSQHSGTEKTLKDALKGKFYMGTALNLGQITGKDVADIDVIKRNFNAIVPENCMKSMFLQPREGEFYFADADRFVQFGEQNGMWITGHCLIWHSQLPRWFFVDEKGNNVSPEVLKARMKSHISTVVGRYKGRIKGWDVVNEAIMEDGSYRKSKFHEILGEEFIPLAFQYAQEADPGVELYYNDYNEWYPGKRATVVRLIKTLKERGIRIDAIGMQGHVGMDGPSMEEYEQTILDYTNAGVKVMVTEFDLSILPSPRQGVGADVATNFAYQKELNPYTESVPDSASIAWTNRMSDFFKLFLKYPGRVSRVTMWGVTDGGSWKNNFPVRGRTDYPLLFDRKYRAKPVVAEIIRMAEKKQLQAQTNTYTADNGNGTYTNPISFEDIPDPAMVRAGDDYYLTSSTMHIMPGLPVWHSRDLVNWKLINYAFDRFDLGPEFRFEPDPTENNRRDMYGRGIWAPAFVYHKGMFYIFANVNRHTVQVFQTDNPAGKWKHHVMKRGLHDLGVFFDDDDKKYVVWGAGTITLAELNDDLTDIKPETQKVIATGVGEGSHVYKINGKYLIIWAVPGATTPMQCGIADRIEGPYEVRAVSEKDHQGYLKGLTLHQGGIIQTPLGEWWGYSMQDRDGIGRMTNLAPITWYEGFPYFGLPGNLTKTPRTWVKPDMGKPAEPITPAMPRSDSFDNPKLGIQWGWNHVPDDAKWSLTEKPGKLRLHSLPADNFWYAKNTLTQKAVGPDSYASVSIDASALKEGDIAGLALLTSPYAWLGIEKTGKDYQLTMYKQAVQPRRPDAGKKAEDSKYTVKTSSPHIRLKVHTDFVADVARFSYSAGDGGVYYPIGEAVPLHFTMTTFQGIRYALFHFNSKGTAGGYADFDNFTVDETYPHGFRAIPYAKTVLFKNKAENASFLTIQGMDEFFVDNLKLGRVALRANDGSFVSVDSLGTVSLKKGKPDTPETFQWIELDDGSVALLSLVTNRYLTIAKGNVNVLTDIPAPDRKDGASFDWIMSDSIKSGNP